MSMLGIVLLIVLVLLLLGGLPNCPANLSAVARVERMPLKASNRGDLNWALSVGAVEC